MDINMLSYHITISGSILLDCFPIYFFPRLFGSYGNNIYLCSADLEFVMEQKEVIRNIKRVAMQTLPPRSSLLLYGSRARGDAHADSDWDLLILLDKQFLEAADYRVAYPFRELGWEIGEELNPSLYTKKQWNSWTYLPYYKNVERDKIVII